MRKLLILKSLVVLFAIAATLTSCDKKKQLEQAIVEQNKHLTEFSSPGYKCTGVTYEGDIVKFAYTVTDESLDINEIINNPEETRQKLLLGLYNSDEATKQLTELIKDCGASVEYCYTSASGKKASAKISGEEAYDAARIVMPKNQVAAKRLEIEIAAFKKQLPMDVAEGVKISDVSKDAVSLNIVYTGDILAPIIQNVKSMTDAQEKKTSMAEFIADSNMELIRTTCIDAGLGIKLVFKSEKTADSVDIIYTVEDMKEINAELRKAAK